MEVFATIQSFNFCHFFCGQCEIEEVKVLLHTIFVNRFRNDNHIILKEETKGCLCSSFPYFSSIFVRTGLVNISLRPSANGPHAKVTFYVEELS